MMVPLSSRAAQARPQQSSLLAHGSPAGRQSALIAQIPPMHVPPQQSWAVMHGSPAGAQAAPPQRPPAQPSAQHAPAFAQLCPSEEQPLGLAQTSAPEPAGSGAQTYEQ